jgi:hypothetical protein
MGAIAEPDSASDMVAYGQPCRWVVMGLPGAGVRLRRQCTGQAWDSWIRAGGCGWSGLCRWCFLLFGLAQLWSLGRDRLGRLGQAGVVVSAFALAAMALGNGIELYAGTARGTESDIGHTSS